MAAPPEYPKKVYLNGEILDADRARISVFDRGFLLGDGIYEVMAQIGGRFFYREAHLDRLATCLDKIGIRIDLRILDTAIPDVLEASGLSGKDCLLYIQVTRGTAPRQHAFPAETPPTLMMYAWAKSLPEIESRHARVILRDDYRWHRCDIKSISLLGNVLANQAAMEAEGYETAFTRDGVITEASHCNLFFVRGSTVYTHPADEHILDGITRIAVLDICRELGIPVVLEGVPKDGYPDMDEAFLTGTSTQVMAVRELENHRYFDSEPGPVTRRIQQAFARLKARS